MAKNEEEYEMQESRNAPGRMRPINLTQQDSREERAGEEFKYIHPIVVTPDKKLDNPYPLQRPPIKSKFPSDFFSASFNMSRRCSAGRPEASALGGRMQGKGLCRMSSIPDMPPAKCGEPLVYRAGICEEVERIKGECSKILSRQDGVDQAKKSSFLPAIDKKRMVTRAKVSSKYASLSPIQKRKTLEESSENRNLINPLHEGHVEKRQSCQEINTFSEELRKYNEERRSHSRCQLKNLELVSKADCALKPGQPTFTVNSNLFFSVAASPTHELQDRSPSSRIKLHPVVRKIFTSQTKANSIQNSPIRIPQVFLEPSSRMERRGTEDLEGEAMEKTAYFKQGQNGNAHTHAEGKCSPYAESKERRSRKQEFDFLNRIQDERKKKGSDSPVQADPTTTDTPDLNLSSLTFGNSDV